MHHPPCAEAKGMDIFPLRATQWGTHPARTSESQARVDELEIERGPQGGDNPSIIIPFLVGFEWGS